MNKKNSKVPKNLLQWIFTIGLITIIAIATIMGFNDPNSAEYRRIVAESFARYWWVYAVLGGWVFLYWIVNIILIRKDKI